MRSAEVWANEKVELLVVSLAWSGQSKVEFLNPWLFLFSVRDVRVTFAQTSNAALDVHQGPLEEKAGSQQLKAAEAGPTRRCPA